MTPQELLLKAADHIEQHGKIGGRWVPDAVANDPDERGRLTCPACVGGAIAVEVTQGREFSPNMVRRPSERRLMEETFEFLVQRLNLPTDQTLKTPALDSIIVWSDTYYKTEVVMGLRRAATP